MNHLGLIQFRGHFLKGGYDDPRWQRRRSPGDPAGSLITSSRLVRSGWCWMRARAWVGWPASLTSPNLAFRNWVRRAHADRTKGQTGLTSEEREELRRLRKEKRRLRVERDVLKNLRARARPSCPKIQTNSRLACRAVSIVIAPWRAPDLGRVGGDVGDSGSPYAQGKHYPATGCHR